MSSALRDLLWWSSLDTVTGIGRTLWKSPTTMELDTDASSYTWGAVRDHCTPARGYFDLASRGAHINRTELFAIFYAIEAFPYAHGPGVERVGTDSKVLMSIVNLICSRSPALHRDVARLRTLLKTRGLGIGATWLASLEKTWTDRLSRERDSTDWQLARSVLSELARAWGPLTMDRFASPLSIHRPRFNAFLACPGAEAIDAMAQTWAGEGNYCAPPFSMAAAVLRKSLAERDSAVVVFPAWPAQPWWRRAVSRATTAVLLLAAATQYTRGRCAPPATRPSWQMVAFYFRRGGTPPTAAAGGPSPPIPLRPPSAPPAPAPARPPAS